MKKKLNVEKLMKSLKYIAPLLLIVVLIPYYGKVESDAIEELALPAGISFDVTQNTSGQILYQVTAAIYNFDNNKVSTAEYKGTAPSLGQTRQQRSTILERKLIFGVERAYIIGEGMAEVGVDNIINILTTNPMINDRSWVVICKGKAEDILKGKLEPYPSVVNYIEKLVHNSVHYNFFGENYKVIDLFVRDKSEGKSVVLPYIEFNEGKIQITGLAIFKQGEMIIKTDMEDTKRLNMLREKESLGIITLQKSSKEYVDLEAAVKRSVKCTKENGAYKFIINLKVNGEIISNRMYKKLSTNVEQKKKFEQDMTKHIENICNDFLDKMKNQYKVDCLELGLVACATYGRNTGVNWDEIVCNSKIKVNVQVEVDRYGRGDY